MSTPPLPGPERSSRAFRLLLAVLVVIVVGGGLAAVVLLVPGRHKSTATRPPYPTASLSTDRGASASVSASGTSSSGASSSTTGDPSASLQQEITADYRRFLSVNDQVFNNSTADVNLFSSVATGDELTHLIELTSQMRGRGYVSTGETRVVSTSVVVASATRATVTACIDTSGVTTIDEKTGQAVGHGSGRQTEIVYMTPVAMTWKVSGGPPQPTAGTC